MVITQRQIDILFSLIDAHVRTAEPVGSKFLAEEFFPDLSSATIRNELGVIEAEGYLTQRHTSGGRVPTDRAYRLYVNYLTGGRTPHLRPAVEQRVRDRIRHTPLSERGIHHTVADLVNELAEAVAITGTLDEERDFYKTGLAQLFELPEFRDFERMFSLAKVFDDFESLFEQFELHASRRISRPVQVFIGEESGLARGFNETVILARYALPGRRQGSLTVIGPMRMNYSRNIAVVQTVVDEVNNLVHNA